MHKLKVYITTSICFLLFACEKKNDIPLTGIFVNDNKYILIEKNRLLFPINKKYITDKDQIILDGEKYTKLNILNSNVKFDSIELSYNVDNYESIGIKEFDVKLFPKEIIFYDVEKNVCKKIALDENFDKWISFSLKNINNLKSNIDRRNNKSIVCLITYYKGSSKVIYNNNFNNEKSDFNLLMTLLYTYLTIHRENGEPIKSKANFKSLDSLNHFVDKNNIGLKRIPLPDVN